MIDPPAQRVRGTAAPLLRHTFGCEGQQLERVAFGVPKLEGADAAGVGRQALRAADRDRTPACHARELPEGGPDIGDHERAVLKTKVRGSNLGRIGSPGHIELEQLDALLSERQQRAARTADHAERGFEPRAAPVLDSEQRATEGLAVEIRQAADIGRVQTESSEPSELRRGAHLTASARRADSERLRTGCASRR
ncbi:MAG TPA: hypothetical protein VGP20_08420 [Steroidobacteraceae bacterium]|jgi:hypothetical protein|nr:hypothetical protein [Steroidobacteraceae bacterium]